MESVKPTRPPAEGLEVSENNLYNLRALPLLYVFANITVEISCQALFILLGWIEVLNGVVNTVEKDKSFSQINPEEFLSHGRKSGTGLS